MLGVIADSVTVYCHYRCHCHWQACFLQFLYYVSIPRALVFVAWKWPSMFFDLYSHMQQFPASVFILKYPGPKISLELSLPILSTPIPSIAYVPSNSVRGSGERSWELQLTQRGPGQRPGGQRISSQWTHLVTTAWSMWLRKSRTNDQARTLQFPSTKSRSLSTLMTIGTKCWPWNYIWKWIFSPCASEPILSHSCPAYKLSILKCKCCRFRNV